MQTMSRRDLALSAIILIGTFAIIAGGYVWFRYWQVDSWKRRPWPNMYTNAESEKIFAEAPAMVCTFSGGTFIGSASGTRYVLDGLVRWDSFSVSGARRTIVHRVLRRDGTAYRWDDSSNVGFIESPQTEDTDLALQTYSCSPWWRPDQSVFRIPDNLTFEPYVAS